MLIDYQPPLHPYLEILYQDDDILVLNKPSGLLSVPGKAPEHQDSLSWRVQRVFPTARVVHRLDMATSGLVVMAMHLQSQRHLNRQFAERQVQKRYIAWIEGLLAVQTGTIEVPLICDWPKRPQQKVCFVQGKKACTHFQLLTQTNTASKVALIPVTGRSHQLRVHMQWLGHPIVGDKFYNDHALPAKERLLLHAESLQFYHPNHGNWLRFHSDCQF
ncbi:pseudouridine synthase [Alkalimonas sp. MEB108]|uniref:Dual-specificity RNA pseudouridine synthase RluA n=1 Tax=Alkalimonas cellulosilytica TaxID=3058395 RepID=A0ABU7J970_9GAMM|nr:pseudouridine synthase [Alkalimonas sp. MEB108]MEE2002760.1 pseudouridine synthase [Alkalimonas sp. MEB108]